MSAGDTSSGTAITVDFIFLGIALLFLLLRLYARVHILNTFAAPDLLILIAWLFFFGNCIVDQLLSEKYGLWHPGIRYTGKTLPKFEKFVTSPTLLEEGLKLRYGTVPFYYIVVYAVKAAFLVMYYEMFPRDMVKLRIAIWTTVGVVAVGFVLTLGLNLGWCQPVSRNWALTLDERCLSWASPIPYIFVNIFNIISDLLVYILPFFLLRRLYNTATRGQFIGIIAIFSLGALCIVCTLGKLTMIGGNATWPLAACWYAAEQACAVIVACCPPLKYIAKRSRNNGNGNNNNNTNNNVHNNHNDEEDEAMPTVPVNRNRRRHRRRNNSSLETTHIASIAIRRPSREKSGMIAKSKALFHIKTTFGKVRNSLSPRNAHFPRSSGDGQGESLPLSSAASRLRSPSHPNLTVPPHESGGDVPAAPPHTFYNNNHLHSGTIITTSVERPQTSENELYLPQENRDLILNGLARSRKSELIRGADEVPFTPTVDDMSFEKFLMQKRMSQMSQMTNNRQSVHTNKGAGNRASSLNPVRDSAEHGRPVTAPMDMEPSTSTASSKIPFPIPTFHFRSPSTLSIRGDKEKKNANEKEKEKEKSKDNAIETKKSRKRAFAGGHLSPSPAPGKNPELLSREADEVPFTPTLTIDFSGELKKATRRVFTGALLAPKAIKSPGQALSGKKSDLSLAATVDSMQAQPFTPPEKSEDLNKSFLPKPPGGGPSPPQDIDERRKSNPANAPKVALGVPLTRLSTHSAPPLEATSHARRPSRPSAVSTPSDEGTREKQLSSPLSTSGTGNEVFSTTTFNLSVPSTPDTPATPPTALLFAPFTPMRSTASNPPPTPSDFPPRSTQTTPEKKNKVETRRTAESDNTLGIWGKWRRNSGATTPTAMTPMGDGNFPNTANYHSPNTPTVIPQNSSSSSSQTLTRKASTKSSRSLRGKNDLAVLTFGGDETEDVIMEAAFGATPTTTPLSPTSQTKKSAMVSATTQTAGSELNIRQGPPPIPERKPGSAVMTSPPGLVPMPTMASVAAKHSADASGLRRKASTRSAKLAEAAALASKAQQQKEEIITSTSPSSPPPQKQLSAAELLRTLTSASSSSRRSPLPRMTSPPPPSSTSISTSSSPAPPRVASPPRPVASAPRPKSPPSRAAQPPRSLAQAVNEERPESFGSSIFGTSV